MLHQAHRLRLAAAFLFFSTAFFAQNSTLKNAAPLADFASAKIFQIDSIVAATDAALENFELKTAERADGSNREKIFAYLTGADFTLLRNEMDNPNGWTENRFYLREGQVACWSLLRRDAARQLRLTIYYCENGKIFAAQQKRAPADGKLETADFESARLDDAASMTEFMLRKFQSLKAAFSQDSKPTGGG